MEFNEKLEEIKRHFEDLIDEETAFMLTKYYFGEKFVVAKKLTGFFAYSDGKRTVILREKPEIYDGFVNAKRGQKIEILVQNGKIIDYKSLKDFRNIFTPLCDLKPGKYYCVRGLVSGIGGIKEVKGNRKIALLNLTDKKTFVTLVLWDDKVKYYSKADIGDEIALYNVFVNEFDGKINIHAGKNAFVELR